MKPRHWLVIAVMVFVVSVAGAVSYGLYQMVSVDNLSLTVKDVVSLIAVFMGVPTTIAGAAMAIKAANGGE